MMIDENLWCNLEENIPRDSGRVIRRVLVEKPHEVFIALTFPDLNRELVIRCPRVEAFKIPDLDSRIVHIEYLKVQDAEEFEIRIVLVSNDAKEVFTSLCNDLVSQLLSTDSRIEGCQKILERFRLWKHLLSPDGLSGLSRMEQQGLVGELTFLLDLLKIRADDEVVSAWVGPGGDSTDFVYQSWGIEVKTSSRLSPAMIRISSERQLSSIGLSSLYLVTYLMRSREDGSGVSLADLVEEIRRILPPEARDHFEGKLLEAKYLDIHKTQYQRRAYEVVQERLFAVSPGFPALVQEELPPGIGRVSYDLALDACTDFERTGTPAAALFLRKSA